MHNYCVPISQSILAEREYYKTDYVLHNMYNHQSAKYGEVIKDIDLMNNEICNNFYVQLKYDMYEYI